MRILILGGTTEAAALARALASDPRFEATLSLAGVTRAPAPLPIPTRIGGFGGAAGLAAHLRAEGIAALIDATHPFATRISRNAEIAARECEVPRLVILRPPWSQVAGDRWQVVPDMEQAAEALGRIPRRVLLTVGRQDLAPFVARPWHRYVIRSVDPPDEALRPPRAEIIAARGPFDEAAERALLLDRDIGAIVTKSSGGAATAGKLRAARKLGVAVVMVARPPPSDGETVADAEGALRWLSHQAATPRGV